MSLLQQTIQEYLTENHPGWTAVSYTPGTIYLDSMKKAYYYVQIVLCTQSISTHNQGYIQTLFQAYYNETTLLALISKAIDEVQ